MAGHWALTGPSPCSAVCSWLWPGLEVLQPSTTLKDGTMASTVREAVRNCRNSSVQHPQTRGGGGGKTRRRKRFLRGGMFFFSNRRFHHLGHIFPNLTAHHAAALEDPHLILTRLGKCPLESFTAAFPFCCFF